MGLFDYVHCDHPSFVCSEGHDLRCRMRSRALQHVLDEAQRDRDALLAIMAVLAPNEWRWQLAEHWREARKP